MQQSCSKLPTLISLSHTSSGIVKHHIDWQMECADLWLHNSLRQFFLIILCWQTWHQGIIHFHAKEEPIIIIIIIIIIILLLSLFIIDVIIMVIIIVVINMIYCICWLVVHSLCLDCSVRETVKRSFCNSYCSQVSNLHTCEWTHSSFKCKNDLPIVHIEFVLSQ